CSPEVCVNQIRCTTPGPSTSAKTELPSSARILEYVPLNPSLLPPVRSYELKPTAWTPGSRSRASSPRSCSSAGEPEGRKPVAAAAIACCGTGVPDCASRTSKMETAGIAMGLARSRLGTRCRPELPGREPESAFVHDASLEPTGPATYPGAFSPRCQ